MIKNKIYVKKASANYTWPIGCTMSTPILFLYNLLKEVTNQEKKNFTQYHLISLAFNT